MKNKIIEVRLNGLNKLGAQELNEYYKHHISKSYIETFQLGDTLGIKKKRFKQIKSFDEYGGNNFITNFGWNQLSLGKDGEENYILGTYFSLLLKHFEYDVFEITEIITKRNK